MPKNDSRLKRDARKLQRETGVRYTEALAQVQREVKSVGNCPDCGSYDLDTEHGGGGQLVQVCNACPWSEG